MTGIFATKEQFDNIQRLLKEKPLSEMFIKPFMEYHRIRHMMDMPRALAEHLILVMDGKMKLPQKPKTKRKDKHE